MNQTNQKRWLVDAALFTGFLTCFFLNLTGVALHQWLGLMAGAASAYHLLAHSSWVKAVTARFFGRTSTQARIYYLIDAVLLAGFLGMITTGLVISTWLNLSLASYASWRALHILASAATLVVVTFKIGLHSRWITMTGRRIFYGTETPQPNSATAKLFDPFGANRRSTLKLMGIVGAASMIAFSSSLKSLWSQDSSTGQAANVSSISANSIAESLADSSAYTCKLRCGKRCTYPGRCRRYTDSNQNGRCDLGECLS